MKVSGIDASYYYAKDLDRAVAFYTALLGAPPTASYPNTFAEWVFPGDEAFGLYMGSQYEHCDGLMFGVDDVAAAVAELRARGVEFSGEIEETPVCHMAFGTDSEGNGFILHQRK
ncbi:MAG: VOC family protein [Candidatus Lustribacter sp.]|jgi:predicted enzyme related to lactoylglutathione lyase